MKLRLAGTMLAALAVSAAQAAGYALDPTHTFAFVEIRHAGTSTLRARFDRKQGQIEFDRAARSGRVEISVDMDSLSSGVAALDAQLKGKGLLDVAAHPTASFVGERFVFSGDTLTEVAGTLTLRGRSGPLVLKATNFNCYQSPLLRREVCGGDFEALIPRSALGPDPAQAAAAPDGLRLLVQVEAIRQP